MNHRPVSLSEFFCDHQQRSESLALATVVATTGSTYRKAGAQMLMAADRSAAGLLSGGCLESDLAEHALTVISSGQPVIVEYDTRSSDDVLWGIGLGCEGAMKILLTRLSPANGYAPFAFQERSRARGHRTSIVLVSASNNSVYPLGTAYFDDAVAALPSLVRSALIPAAQTPHLLDADAATFLIVPVLPPIRLLVLGAGPDAQPLVEIAGLMGWQVTVLDHRAAYAVAERFPRARQVAVNPANALASFIVGKHFDAAVVMSHHLTSDQAYLDALADSTIGYVGLLGPAARRTRLFMEPGEKSSSLGARLHGPIGLDIGANTPETIALAIVAEIQAVLAKRPGGSFNLRAPQTT